MKTVVSYLKGIPNNKNQEKIQVLENFVIGALNKKDKGILHDEYNWIPSDVAVIQGYVHENSPSKGHLKLRKTVLDKQRQFGKHTIIVDSNLFLYVNQANPKHYLRYSMDGIFPTTANYFWDNPNPDRWKSISKNLKLSLKDYRTQGDHILICLQRNGGWSMQGVDVMTWCHDTIYKLQKLTDRPIVVRAHPGDKAAQRYLKLNYPKVKVSFAPSITDDLRNAWATITYNSSPGVASAIEGVPVFVTDPNPEISQAYDIANTDLDQIENPNMPERQKWIEKISMSHWNFVELKSGEAWSHMRGYC